MNKTKIITAIVSSIIFLTPMIASAVTVKYKGDTGIISALESRTLACNQLLVDKFVAEKMKPSDIKITVNGKMTPYNGKFELETHTVINYTLDKNSFNAQCTVGLTEISSATITNKDTLWSYSANGWQQTANKTK